MSTSMPALLMRRASRRVAIASGSSSSPSCWRMISNVRNAPVRK